MEKNEHSIKMCVMVMLISSTNKLASLSHAYTYVCTHIRQSVDFSSAIVIQQVRCNSTQMDMLITLYRPVRLSVDVVLYCSNFDAFLFMTSVVYTTHYPLEYINP